ncbi:MAG: adenylate/guanylate cyclase domain-containing protein [Candidatus Nitrosopolaris sp.]|nr:adenylate/guanylate cyclase domain-containing protein [Candidatus Eisenbacteria bacterium]
MHSVGEKNDNISNEDRKKNLNKQSGTINSTRDMILASSNGSSANSRESQQVTVDTETLVAQTQDRMWRALKRRYQYDANLEPAQAFLLNHINSKIPLVIMYVDLVGSTNMSMTLPIDKLVSIIRAFTYEMSSVIQSHKGYVLKYVGDAVIAFFPSNYNKLLACDNAVYCAQSMITVVRNGINPILNQYDYPELSIKIAIDEGENTIVQYGHHKSSLIDILSYCMSIAAKITSITEPDRITIGEDVYNLLHPSLKTRFKRISLKDRIQDWKYTNRQTGQLYNLYLME